jgi:hypothetical protein
MSQYFVAKEGIQKGPWSLDEIVQSIQSKSLTWNDYIYDEKANVWLFLFEFPLLTDVFNKSFKNPLQKTKLLNDYDLFKDRLWYILKQNENYGPFTAIEMIQMLQSKTLYEYDFIWRQGQPAWQRLADVHDFRPEKVKEIYESLSVDEQKKSAAFFRRRYPRAVYQCEILLHNEKKLYNAENLEIGFGGACFSLEGVDFPLESEVHLHFRPGHEVPAFNAICKVVSRNGFKYGVSFVKVSHLAQESIAQYTGQLVKPKAA